jgi:hypothetical protein
MGPFPAETGGRRNETRERPDGFNGPPARRANRRPSGESLSSPAGNISLYRKFGLTLLCMGLFLEISAATAGRAMR